MEGSGGLFENQAGGGEGGEFRFGRHGVVPL
jgi:hypothetical protein